MKKTKCINNCQNYDIFDNSLTQRKEVKTNSLIPLQENMNNPLINKSENSCINIPSQISCKEKIFPENYPMTPFKKINNLNSSSNKYKNFSSSGSIWHKSKNFNNNNDDNYAKRKLFISNMSVNSNNIQLQQKQNFNFVFENFLYNETNINNNINVPLFTPSKNNIELSKEIKKNINNKNETESNNKGANINKLFFTEYGVGYKCNCTKTGCNKFYCQCYNQGRYCHGCNCQNCLNKLPENILSNKRPKDEEKLKTIIISCTCTKSSCNKNYCECYKNKMKCNSQCRCRNCENIDPEKSESMANIFNSTDKKYQCCEANSIYIIKNRIIIEELTKGKENRKIKIMTDEALSEFSSGENKNIGIKRKREDKNPNLLSNKKFKISDENTNDNLQQKKNDYTESDLFDKEGNLILTHIKL